jgi:hypothetical protein
MKPALLQTFQSILQINKEIVAIQFSLFITLSLGVVPEIFILLTITASMQWLCKARFCGG